MKLQQFSVHGKNKNNFQRVDQSSRRKFFNPMGSTVIPRVQILIYFFIMCNWSTFFIHVSSNKYPKPTTAFFLSAPTLGISGLVNSAAMWLQFITYNGLSGAVVGLLTCFLDLQQEKYIFKLSIYRFLDLSIIWFV